MGVPVCCPNIVKIHNNKEGHGQTAAAVCPSFFPVMLSMLSLLLYIVVPRAPVIVQEVFAPLLPCLSSTANRQLSFQFSVFFFFLPQLRNENLALSLLVSGICLADNVQIAIMSLAGLASNNLLTANPVSAPSPSCQSNVPHIPCSARIAS